MDKFGKEKAKARDKVVAKGAYPHGMDIHKDDEYLETGETPPRNQARRAPPRDDPASHFVYFGDAYIRRDAISALLYAQKNCLTQRHLFDPMKKRRKAFFTALKAAGFRGEQIRLAFLALLSGVVIPELPAAGEPPTSGLPRLG